MSTTVKIVFSRIVVGLLILCMFLNVASAAVCLATSKIFWFVGNVLILLFNWSSVKNLSSRIDELKKIRALKKKEEKKNES